jgi:hypothetical protein
MGNDMKYVKGIDYVFGFRFGCHFEIAEKIVRDVDRTLSSYVGRSEGISDIGVDVKVYEDVWGEVVYREDEYVEYWGDGIEYIWHWSEDEDDVMYFGFSNNREFSENDLKLLGEKVVFSVFRFFGEGKVEPTGEVKKYITYEETEEVIYNI